MDIQAEKLELVQAVLNIDDINLIHEVRELLKSRDYDWFDDLSEEQQQSVFESIKELDNGEGIPHAKIKDQLGL